MTWARAPTGVKVKRYKPAVPKYASTRNPSHHVREVTISTRRSRRHRAPKQQSLFACASTVRLKASKYVLDFQEIRRLCAVLDDIEADATAIRRVLLHLDALVFTCDALARSQVRRRLGAALPPL